MATGYGGKKGSSRERSVKEMEEQSKKKKTELTPLQKITAKRKAQEAKELAGQSDWKDGGVVDKEKKRIARMKALKSLGNA